ncbi:MAG: PAS domain-containing protein, partial [Candidatus Desantisbacteria bacterium]
MEKTFETIFEKAKGYCRDKTDLVHLVTVLEMAKKLIQLEGGNERIIIPAVILHDTGWRCFSYTEELKARKIHKELKGIELTHKHETESANLSESILSELNWPLEEKSQIIEIVAWHDTRTNPISKEDGIVKDADRLSRYTPQCFDLFCLKFKNTQEQFFEFLSLNIERWFYTESAKYMAREYLLKRRLGIMETEFEEKLPNEVYKILIRLEGEVARKTKKVLEEIIIKAAREKIYDVAEMLKLYLANRKYIDLRELQEDEQFYVLATQKVGEGGYIGVIDRQTGKIIFHPDRRIINLLPEEVEKGYRPDKYLHGFWDWHKRARSGEEFYSYYQGMNIKGEVVDKFQYVLPINIKDVQWSLVCTAVYTDFFKHIDILSQDIIQSVSNVSEQIGELARALVYEKEQLDVTLHSIGDGVIVADTQGKVVLLNKVAEELTGWKEEESIGKPTGDIFRPVQLKFPTQNLNFIYAANLNSIVPFSNHLLCSLFLTNAVIEARAT